MHHRSPCFVLSLALILTALLPCLASGQTGYEWGIIPPADLHLKQYPLDSSAVAAILIDDGKATVFSSSDNYGHLFKHYRRIKLFKKAGFEWADVRIPYYSYQRTEQIISIRARITLPNGVYYELSPEDFHREQSSERWSALTFAFPKVEEGAVLEYSYDLSSNHMMELKPWYFQASIPVRYSQLRVDNESRFSYATLFEPGTDMERETLPDGSTAFVRGENRILISEGLYKMENAPAIRKEAFVTTMDDYRTRIRFQLSEAVYPNGQQVRYLDSWESAARRLYEEPSFGHHYRKGRYYKQLLRAAAPHWSGMDTEWEKAQAIYDFLSEHIRWDGQFRSFPRKQPDESFEQKSASSAELTLALLALLREAGIEAVPVLTSTRSHGKMAVQYPIIDQFNHVMAMVKIEGKGFVLDMPGAGLPMGLLHPESLNGMGWMMDPDGPSWIIITPQHASRFAKYSLEAIPEGILQGSITCRFENYDALREREALATLSGSQHWANRLGADLSIQRITYKGLKGSSQGVEAELEARLSSSILTANDFIYLSLPYLSDFKENPFRLEQRTYPVEMPYPLQERLVLEVKIPEGYEVKSIPEQLQLELPGGGASFSFIAGTREGRIKVAVNLLVEKTRYKPEEYAALKAFFRQVADKLNEQLVLEK